MSTSTQSTTVECHYPGCSTLGNHWEFRHGKYCSTDCETRHDGHKRLYDLRTDHRCCFTCFRTLKTVNPPKPDFEFTERGHGWALDENGDPQLEYYSQEVTRSAATGFQFDTESATKGEKQRGQNADRVITGTICGACGNTSHAHHDQDLADHDAVARLIDLLARDDETSVEPVTLHRVYANSADLDLAVGHALRSNP